MSVIRFICAEPWCEQQVVVSAIDHDKLVAELEAAEAGISTVVAHTAAEVAALRLQLSRAREWMRHKPECLIAKGYDKYAPRTITIDLQGASVITKHHGVYIGSDDAPKGNCTCGLTEFLKEVGK